MSITFGGLATGLDTSSIIDALMEIERQPITRLEADRTYFESRQQAVSTLHDKLSSFLSGINSLGSSDDLRQKAVSVSNENFFSASASVDAVPGTSYQVEVVSLTQGRKEVSPGYAASTVFGGTAGDSLQIAGKDGEVTIDLSTAKSLQQIATAINDADTGVIASIINDGTDTPYRLVLTGDGNSDFTSTETGITLGLFESQAASKAHIRVDNVDIYSDSNTLSEAIPGVTLDLLHAEEGTTTTVSVSLDEAAIKSQIQGFVDGYNAVMSYISEQTGNADTDGGILSGDPGMNGVKRRLQSLLTTTVSNTGSFQAFSQLGLQTQKDGTLVLDDSTLSAAIRKDLGSVEKLLVGEGDTDGIAARFQDYLTGVTNYFDGIYAANKKSTAANLDRIDTRIEQLEARLEKREETMRAKFSAMEALVSGINSQSTFLTQQMDMLSNMMTRN